LVFGTGSWYSSALYSRNKTPQWDFFFNIGVFVGLE
jgi:hypothetical protein